MQLTAWCFAPEFHINIQAMQHGLHLQAVRADTKTNACQKTELILNWAPHAHTQITTLEWIYIHEYHQYNIILASPVLFLFIHFCKPATS